MLLMTSEWPSTVASRAGAQRGSWPSITLPGTVPGVHVTV